jgi:choline dehydrogenase
LFVSDVRRQLHPMARHFFAAAQQAGLPLTEDFNGPAPEGVGRYRINTRRGMRWSAADAFLRPALRRGQVTLATGALAERVLFEGRKAVGVAYRQGGVRQTARARAAVVLSAGAIQSPQLLQLSGVGPGALLQQHGIDPGAGAGTPVGANLQDHLAMSYYYKATEPTLNNVCPACGASCASACNTSPRLGGPLSISVNQCGGFVRSHPMARHRPTCSCIATRSPTRWRPPRPARRSCRTASPASSCASSPAGRSAAAASRSPARTSHTAPAHRPATCRIRRCRPGAARRATDPAAGVKHRGHAGLILEPIATRLDTMDDAAMVEDFRNRASTCYHPVGTCMMGAGSRHVGGRCAT